MRAMVLGVLGVVVAACVSGCTVRSRRPDGPYRLAEEFVDALSDEAVACVQQYPPRGSGTVLVAAELTPPGQPPVIHDLGSPPGSEAAFGCVRERAADELRCPPSAPAPFALVRVPVPLVTSKVTYAFLRELPPHTDAPPSAGP